MGVRHQAHGRRRRDHTVGCIGMVTENVEIVRWIELSAAVLLFLLVPGDRESGAVYALDRTKGIWYSVDFQDEEFGG